MVNEIKLTRTEQRPTEVPDGTVSLVESEDFLPTYTEAAHKFLKDNEGLGDEWVKDASSKLLIYQDKKGDVAQSNSYAGVLAASIVPMVEHDQLRRLCEQKGTNTPFGPVYIDFGVQINGKPNTNEAQAKYILEQMKARSITSKNPRLFSFNQLELKASQEAGLVFGIREGVEEGSVENLDSSKFNYFGRDGLFRAYLDSDGWVALGGVLAYSYDNGRVVRYDAEGVARAKIKTSEPQLTLADRLVNEYKGN